MMNMKFYTSGGTKTKVEYKIPQNNMTK